MATTWVIERRVFASGDDHLLAAIREAGDTVVEWSDDWWESSAWPQLEGRPVLVRASLGNAARIQQELPWRPGPFCNPQAFRASAYYASAQPWLLHRTFGFTTVGCLVADPRAALQALESSTQKHPERVFVRPDSPLKPFSGRVVATDSLRLSDLDHGYYYDDENLPIVVAPVRTVNREWRFVVVNGRVIAGSAYSADGRRPLPDDPAGPAWQLAQKIAQGLPAPAPVYVLDVCESDGELYLLELNPFGGADLYACDPTAIVREVGAMARTATRA